MLAAVRTKRQAGVVSCSTPQWGAVPPVSRGGTAAQVQGLRYERHATRMLEDTFAFTVPQLGFRYFNANAQGFWCWTDACIFSDDMRTVTICEIKWHHTVDAWVQLSELYAPVVQVAFPHLQVRLLEVCKFYDPAVRLPGRVKLMASVEDLRGIVQGEEHADFSVLIWTGR